MSKHLVVAVFQSVLKSIVRGVPIFENLLSLGHCLKGEGGGFGHVLCLEDIFFLLIKIVNRPLMVNDSTTTKHNHQVQILILNHTFCSFFSIFIGGGLGGI